MTLLTGNVIKGLHLSVRPTKNSGPNDVGYLARTGLYLKLTEFQSLPHNSFNSSLTCSNNNFEDQLCKQ